MIAEKFKRLLTQKTEMLGWKTFLQEVVERLNKKVINEWVKNFFEAAEKQLKKTGMNINVIRSTIEASFKTQRKQFTNPFEHILMNAVLEDFEKKCEHSIKNAKLEIDHQFNEYLPRWKKYFEPSGSGLFVYLKELTTLDLLRIILR